MIALSYVAPPPADLAAYAAVRNAMASIATWIFFPSLGLTLIAGLIALAASRVYKNAGWAWAKAVSGVLIFEAGLIGILGPMQREVERAAKALAAKGGGDRGCRFARCRDGSVVGAACGGDGKRRAGHMAAEFGAACEVGAGCDGLAAAVR